MVPWYGWGFGGGASVGGALFGGGASAAGSGVLGWVSICTEELGR